MNFTLAQAIPTSHPMTEFFPRRDLVEVNRFFCRLDGEAPSVDGAFRKVVGQRYVESERVCPNSELAVGVSVGPDGEVMENIEEKLMGVLQIESGADGVTILLSDKANDPLVMDGTKDFITAISRGFLPEYAFRLIRNEDEILDLSKKNVLGRSGTCIRNA